MNSPYLVILPLALVAVLAAWRSWSRLRQLGDIGFKKKRLLTGNEVDFYHRLRRAVGAQYQVFPQVSMGALLDTTYSPQHPRYWEHRQSFSSRICDFVLCDSKSLTPVLIVELDDVMHDFNKDRVRDGATATAGYPTVRFWSRKKPTPGEIKSILNRHLALEPGAKLI